MGIVRRNVIRFSRITLAAAIAGGLAATAASAQSAEGNWGAEGRIGSGQSAYLLRWFSPSWSLVLGGGLSTASNENAGVGSTTEQRSANLTALMRKEWGTGRVHPFIGFGPTASVFHSVNKSPTGGTATETTSDNNGFGGRFEFGAFASVNQSVGLGLVAAATGQRIKQTTKSSGSAAESESTSNSFGLGNPQFVIRVRF